MKGTAAAVLIAFMAAFIKGVGGTGIGTMVVSLASLVIGVKDAVVLSALLSLYGGIGMFRSGTVSIRPPYFIGICACVVSGTATGSQLLKIAQVPVVECFLAAMLVLVGSIFLFDIQRFRIATLLDSPPDRPSPLDCAMGLLTGVVGISLPVLLFHFGSYLSKQALRHLILLLFIPSAVVQVLTFTGNELMSQKVFVVSLFSLPALFAGVFTGNRLFHRLSEKRFRQCLGILLYCAAVKLAV